MSHYGNIRQIVQETADRDLVIKNLFHCRINILS